MKRFRFALQGLLKVQEAAVDGRRRQLARSEGACRAEEEGVMNLERRIAQSTGVVPREGELDVSALAAEERHLRLLQRHRADALARLRGWIAAVEEDRRHLVQARRKLEATERLRQRRYLEFVREVLREETREIDDVAGVRHQRARLVA